MTSGPPLGTLIHFRKDTAEPLYRQLETQFRGFIDEGRLGPGATLPAERLLAETLGISRTTVKRCYANLREAGFIRSQGRLGFRVEASASGRLSPGLDRLKGFTEEMRELGRVPTSDILACDAIEDPPIAALFDLPATTPFLRLDRVRRGDGVPLSHELAWYNLAAAPDLAHVDPTGSIYAKLQEFGMRLTSCEQWIEATTPTPQECDIFGFSTPRPCLLIKRKSYDKAGRMIEYVEGLFRGDSYAYRLHLSV